MNAPNGHSGSQVGGQPHDPVPMNRYQIRPGGVAVHCNPANCHRCCECRHTYAYPNPIVLAVVEERKALAKDNARLKPELNQLRETIKMQADRIKELEDDVIEGQERTDDLCAQLGEPRSNWLGEH